MRATILFLLAALVATMMAACGPSYILSPPPWWDSAATDTGQIEDTGLPPCDAVAWYRDADGDGFGSATVTTLACVQPDGYVDDATDCDDAFATTYPGAPEVCDAADQDCDGEVDESAGQTWYADMDGDGFGDLAQAVQTICGGVDPWLVADATDCDDANSEVHPGAMETCNGIDDDCDVEVDEEATDSTVWIVDADLDGYGDAALSSYVVACDPPDGYVANGLDCDDVNDTVNPGAAELPGDGLDQNCDGQDKSPEVTCCRDYDGDLYGDAYDCVVVYDDAVCPGGYVVGDGDCNDSNATVYPGAYDSAYDGGSTGFDSNCNGFTSG